MTRIRKDKSNKGSRERNVVSQLLRSDSYETLSYSTFTAECFIIPISSGVFICCVKHKWHIKTDTVDLRTVIGQRRGNYS